MRNGRPDKLLWTVSKLWTISPWIHVLFWFWSQVAIGILLAEWLLIIMARFFERKIPGDPFEFVLIFFASAFFSIALPITWRRFLFLKKDLVKYIQSRGGQATIVDKKVEAKVGKLYINACFDRSFKDFGPLGSTHVAKKVYQKGRVRMKWEGGLHPRHMLRMSKVDFLWFADLHEITGTKFDLKIKDGGAVLDELPRAKELEQAVYKAARESNVEDIEIEVDITPRYLRVKLIGGTWLGRVFGERIIQAMAFTEQLVDLMGVKYESLDADAVTVSEGYELNKKIS